MHDSGVTLPWSRFSCRHWRRVRDRLAPGPRAPPPGPCDMAQARDAVAAIVSGDRDRRKPLRRPPPAGDLKAVGTPTLVADQVFHAAAVLGVPMARTGGECDLVVLPGRISVDGEERANGVGGSDLLGHPRERARVARRLGDVAAAFGGLQAGQIVMLGSVTPPIWLDGPCEVSVVFGAFPPVTVTLD